MSDPQDPRAARARARAAAAAAAGEDDAALEAWAEVCEILRPRPRLRELAALHLEAHRRALEIGAAGPLRPGAGERIWEDGVALARELGCGPDVARLELAFAHFQLLRSLFSSARVHAGRARDVADLFGDPALAARGAAAHAAADLAGGRGGDPDALRERLAALEGRDEADVAAARAVLERRLAWDAAARGDLDAALRHAAQAVRTGGRSDVVARTRAERGWLLVRAGRPASARDEARAALAALPRPDAEGARLAALGVLALAELACGSPAAARAAAVEAADRAEACGVREDLWLPLPCIAAECLAACGESEAARARLARAERSRAPRPTRAHRLHEARALQRLGAERASREARDRAAALRDADPLGRIPWPSEDGDGVVDPAP